MVKASKNLSIDPDLYARLGLLAQARGVSRDELVADVLAGHVAMEEALRSEDAELTSRWRTYVETGKTVPAEDVRQKLQAYATEAVRRAEM